MSAKVAQRARSTPASDPIDDLLVLRLLEDPSWIDHEFFAILEASGLTEANPDARISTVRTRVGSLDARGWTPSVEVGARVAHTLGPIIRRVRRDGRVRSPPAVAVS